MNYYHKKNKRKNKRKYTKHKYSNRKYSKRKYTKRKYSKRKYTKRKYSKRKYTKRKYSKRKYIKQMGGALVLDEDRRPINYEKLSQDVGLDQIDLQRLYESYVLEDGLAIGLTINPQSPWSESWNDWAELVYTNKNTKEVVTRLPQEGVFSRARDLRAGTYDHLEDFDNFYFEELDELIVQINPQITAAGQNWAQQIKAFRLDFDDEGPEGTDGVKETQNMTDVSHKNDVHLIETIIAREKANEAELASDMKSYNSSFESSNSLYVYFEKVKKKETIYAENDMDVIIVLGKPDSTFRSQVYHFAYSDHIIPSPDFALYDKLSLLDARFAYAQEIPGDIDTAIHHAMKSGHQDMKSLRKSFNTYKTLHDDKMKRLRSELKQMTELHKKSKAQLLSEYRSKQTVIKTQTKTQKSQLASSMKAELAVYQNFLAQIKSIESTKKTILYEIAEQLEEFNTKLDENKKRIQTLREILSFLNRVLYFKMLGGRHAGY